MSVIQHCFEVGLCSANTNEYRSYIRETLSPVNSMFVNVTVHSPSCCTSCLLSRLRKAVDTDTTGQTITSAPSPTAGFWLSLICRPLNFMPARWHRRTHCVPRVQKCYRRTRCSMLGCVSTRSPFRVLCYFAMYGIANRSIVAGRNDIALGLHLKWEPVKLLTTQSSQRNGSVLLTQYIAGGFAREWSERVINVA